MVIWDVATSERVVTIGDQFDSVLAADLSSDQRWVALGGPDRVLKIYRTRDGGLEHKTKKHTEWVTAVEFSPDSKYLATGDRNGGLVLWEAETGQEMFTLPGHKGGITGITWRSDSAMLASASEDGTLKLWNARDGAALRSIAAHPGGALAAHFGRDGRIVSCGRDNKVQIWDVSGKNTRTLAFNGDLPNRVTFTDDSQKVIGSDWNGGVFAWDAATGKLLGELDSHPPSLAERVRSLTQRVATLRAEAGRTAAYQAAVAGEVACAHTAVETAKKALLAASAKGPSTDAALKKVGAVAAGGGEAETPAQRSAAPNAEPVRRPDALANLRAEIASAARQEAAAVKQVGEAETAAVAAASKAASAQASLAKWQAVLAAAPAKAAIPVKPTEPAKPAGSAKAAARRISRQDP